MATATAQRRGGLAVLRGALKSREGAILVGLSELQSAIESGLPRSVTEPIKERIRTDEAYRNADRSVLGLGPAPGVELAGFLDLEAVKDRQRLLSGVSLDVEGLLQFPVPIYRSLNAGNYILTVHYQDQVLQQPIQLLPGQLLRRTFDFTVLRLVYRISKLRQWYAHKKGPRKRTPTPFLEIRVYVYTRDPDDIHFSDISLDRALDAVELVATQSVSTVSSYPVTDANENERIDEDEVEPFTRLETLNYFVAFWENRGGIPEIKAMYRGELTPTNGNWSASEPEVVSRRPDFSEGYMPEP